MNANIKKIDVVIVGAGFSGMYLIYELRKQGLMLQCIEAGSDVGGTWYWNRYPGARVDVPSYEYSYSFDKELEQSYPWKEKYAQQAEIHEYQKFVADKHDLRKDILFNTKVTDAVYNETNKLWIITTDRGEVFEARYFITATGTLSVPIKPKINGLENFKGQSIITGFWPKDTTEKDFKGKNVAVIGTGSTGIQMIPVIAEFAKKLSVFHRNGNYTIPAGNRPITTEEWDDIRSRYDEIRKIQRTNGTGVALMPDSTGKSALDYTKEEAYELIDGYLAMGGGIAGLPQSFTDISFNDEANKVIRDYFADKIKSIVKDPVKAEILIPKDIKYGDRRPCVDTDYWETFNRENVELIDVVENSIEEITESGLRLKDGTSYSYDVIIYATGYDAMTGALNRINIMGRNGKMMKEKWNSGPRMYLGLMCNEFPNFFTVTGPGSPSVLSNMIVSIEQHVEWIAKTIAFLEQNNITALEPKLEEEDKWIDHCNEIAEPFFISKGNSWYVGKNIPGKPRIFMPYIGGVGPYAKIIDEISNNGYLEFEKEYASVQAV